MREGSDLKSKLLSNHLFIILSLEQAGICVSEHACPRGAVSPALGHDVDPEEQLSGVKLLGTRMR